METGVDTSALYYYVTDPATLAPDEKRLHEKATDAIDGAYESSASLLIPSIVVIELANILHHRNGLKATETVLEALLSDTRNKVIASPEELFTQALMLSKKTGVKYTDCAIYLTLKKAGAKRIITTDKEFMEFGDLTVV